MLSRATLYALYALVYLAGQEEGRPMASHLIARAHAIPEKYLLKVLRALGDAGLVRSLTGPNGGCWLVKKPRDISLLDVVEAVKGPLQKPIPLRGRDPLGLGVRVRLQAVCDQAAEAVRRQYRKVSLADLVGKG